MSGYLMDFWTALTSLLPVLLVLAVLTLAALILDARSDEEW